MILVCGEALIDLFVGPPEGTEMPARAVAGGSPFNVVVGLARLGVETGFLGGISRDRFGTLLAETLAHEGVDDRFLVRTDRLSTISAVATARDGQPSYSFHGEGAADRSLGFADLPAALPAEVQALTFGSYTMVVEPVGSAFAALAEQERGRRVISVDPNCRPSVVRDMAQWSRAAERFYRTATLIKASDEDVRTAWDGQITIAEAAAYWLDCGAHLVVVTEGLRGATAFCASGQVSVPGRPVIVRDTVGAGDTFHAALLAQLAKTGRLHPDAIAALDLPAIGELLTYATAAAAITVARRGADLPTAAEVEALLHPRLTG
ncbi:carbohydrate kinase [Bosea sp. (in: a-proteobacteria)]|uniref:carbohydrate kinase family protein n=1 Tax=Bosea sp. (in: a-proteobacteria) TaxID=1871050 RepID=UPI0025C54A11|nr:carbohydrate kinase [Bosea sp. (in: a-proteobacteria)]MBR3194548.1 carbohydrate kinase [Bosea sp. (in: a-proteobacteria)]